ncbi:type III polyketide synthase [Mongoliibacter ruber]|uniref:Putative naringenin-chalcone synthase n=1 Tax=Mongoliibacter ruber TaxID=1750599 RepID=A0A2T0WT96_9BACT|nr:type III polyketide synthase [Mongoliibacter ruber]PRY89909.1 putative naringenin-chalcone synthase [Mongoliibacter ruber]
MNNHIVSIGTASPGEAIPQLQISEFMKIAHGLDKIDSRKLNFVYKHSGISSRHSVLQDFNHADPKSFDFFPKNKDLAPFPSTKQRMQEFRKQAFPLAKKAISQCLQNAMTYPVEITHLVLVSCTGMFAPGLELEIMDKMGFNSNVERYSIHFMGCYASFNALKLADRICDSSPKAKVLIVSVELCTLHFQKDYNEDNLLANAIFGDGAAAALVCKDAKGLKIKKYDSQVFKEGENDMAWTIGDFGFEMKLSKYVPDLLQKGLEKITDHLESLYGISKIKNFAVHPGGKQILQKVESAFGINESQNQPSHKVLNQFGNMSSATILFVLQHWLEEEVLDGGILALGFGPGLTLETLLLEK